MHDTGLTTLPVRWWTPAVTLGPRNPDWALGATDFLGNPNVPALSSGETRLPSPSVAANHFSLMHAREAMYRALTGRTGQGQPLPNTATLTTEKDKRNAYWATTFRALGDAMHPLEDLAQPQHSRNEAHSGVNCNERTDSPYDCSLGHRSVYEGYIEARASGANSYTLPSGAATVQQSGPLPRLNYAGYPIPMFGGYREFSTGKHLPGPDASPLDPMGRTGLADYSNRGFFTVAKNLGSRLNDQPLPSRSTITGTTLATRDWNGNPLPNGMSVQLLTGSVPDTLNPASRADDVPLTSVGLFDESLSRRTNGGQREYSLNRYNYDAMAGLLLPRASAYAAGLLNYFFRGRIDWVIDPNNPGQYLLQNLGPEAMAGDFALYYDAVDGKRYPLTGGAWPQVSISPGGQQTITLSAPGASDPQPQNPGEYMLVFRGTMGQEQPAEGTVGAVAGKLVYDPFMIQLQRYEYLIGTGLGPTIYSVWTNIARNPALGDAIDRFGGNMTVMLNGEGIPCRWWAPASLYCDNGDPNHAGITIDAMGTTSWDGRPYFDVNHSLTPSGSVRLNLGNTTLFSLDFAPVGAGSVGVLSFADTFHFDTRNALIGLW